MTASGPHLNIDFEGFSQNPDSPVSEIPDYAGESDLDDVHLDFGSPLTDGGDSSTEVQNDGFGNVTGISSTVPHIQTDNLSFPYTAFTS